MFLDDKVDIIIPVYNAVTCVKQCVSSIYEHISHRINKVILFDDASSEESFEAIKTLDYPNMETYRSDRNYGYGQTVNKAFEKTETNLVLVLNSDVVAESDFLSPLVDAMNKDRRLGAIHPVPESSDKYAGYKDNNGFVITHQLSGYAYLIRKDVFINAGMFDAVYGRGYFEDTALARDIADLGWATGLHRKSILSHVGSSSFTKSEISELYESNEKIYRERYPESCRRVLILSKYKSIDDLSGKAKSLIENTTVKGGRVFFASNEIRDLPNYGIRGMSYAFLPLLSLIYRTFIRGWRRPYTRTTDVFIEEGNKGVLVWMVCFYARRYGVTIHR